VVSLAACVAKDIAQVVQFPSGDVYVEYVIDASLHGGASVEIIVTLGPARLFLGFQFDCSFSALKRNLEMCVMLVDFQITLGRKKKRAIRQPFVLQ
jgi:hypothetical protein